MDQSHFFGPSLKIQRAKELLSELNSRESIFWKQCKPFIDTTPDSKTGRRFAKVRMTDPPPEMIHVLTAEIIYHLRSSLDQIAVRLAIMSNVSKGNLSKVYFPSGKGPKELVLDARGESRPRHRRRASAGAGIKRKEGKIERLDADLVKLILRQKPYPGGDDDLYSIFRLANIDKHVELIPAANRGQLTGMQNFQSANCIVAVMLTSGTSCLYDGIPISELGPDGTIAPLNSDAKIEVSGQIAFGNTNVFDGLPIAPVLNRLIGRVDRLRETITDHCIKTGRMHQNPTTNFSTSKTIVM